MAVAGSGGNQMNRLLIATVGLLCGLSGISSAQDRDVRLVLTQHRVQPGVCDLTVLVSKSIGSIRLWCPTSLRDIVGRRMLTQSEIEKVVDLVLKSDAYGGGATGSDTREVDGPFETMEVQCCQRRDVIVLVTTGNPTFAGDGPRAQLAQLLREWETELELSGRRK
jgi:hypothetical protein